MFITDTLTLLENWYSEPSEGNEKAKLLSKLAVIEFCGWLEGWMDDVLREVDTRSLQDDKWIDQNVISKTNGFDYNRHFRPMLCAILGEHKLRIIEMDFEIKNPGALEDLKSNLGSLWKQRCSFAHADLAAHQAAQLNFFAPSWTKNQHRVLSKRLEEYKNCIIDQL